MERTYWQRQTDKPLFEAIEWSRPSSKALAGNLLIMGGNLHAFSAPAHAYDLANKDGVGSCRVVMPVSVKKLVGHVLPDCEFAPATPSGSFSKKGLAELLAYASWSHATLLAGDLGRNSETAILLEDIVKKSPVPLVVTRDAGDYFMQIPHAVIQRPNTALVVSLAQLQKMAVTMHHPKALTFDMDFFQVVDWLHAFSQQYAAYIVLKHNLNIFVAVKGQVTSTKLPVDVEIWRLTAAVHGAVNWLQNLQKPLEALTHGVYQLAYQSKNSAV